MPDSNYKVKPNVSRDALDAFSKAFRKEMPMDDEEKKKKEEEARKQALMKIRMQNSQGVK